MTGSTPAALKAATEIAEEVLFPGARRTDAADRVPPGHLDLLAEHGFYGLSTMDLPDYSSVLRLVEILAGGCLTTTFVWMQHHGPAMTLARSANEQLREAYLADMLAGAVRAGIAVGAALRPGFSPLRMDRVDGGYLLDGCAPWVTGWGMIDLLQIAARDETDQVLTVLVEATSGESLRVEPQPLSAVQASCTVSMRLSRHFVPDERVVQLLPRAEHLAGDAESQRFNGALALGVAGRAIALLGEEAGSLPAELAATRDRLHRAAPEEVAAARAAGSALALRAAGAYATSNGSRSVLPYDTAERLLREAGFLLVFGSRPGIRAALLERLTA